MYDCREYYFIVHKIPPKAFVLLKEHLVGKHGIAIFDSESIDVDEETKKNYDSMTDNDLKNSLTNPTNQSIAFIGSMNDINMMFSYSDTFGTPNNSNINEFIGDLKINQNTFTISDISDSCYTEFLNKKLLILQYTKGSKSEGDISIDDYMKYLRKTSKSFIKLFDGFKAVEKKDSVEKLFCVDIGYYLMSNMNSSLPEKILTQIQEMNKISPGKLREQLLYFYNESNITLEDETVLVMTKKNIITFGGILMKLVTKPCDLESAKILVKTAHMYTLLIRILDHFDQAVILTTDKDKFVKFLSTKCNYHGDSLSDKLLDLASANNSKIAAKFNDQCTIL